MIQPENEDIVRASLYIQENGINTIRKICNLESIVYNRAVPSGLEDLEKYFSKKEDDLLNILDMNLGHVLRAFSKTIAENHELEEQVHLSFNIKSSLEYKRGWNAAYNQIRNVLFDTRMPTPKPFDDEPKLMEDDEVK
tara:strand:+ start:23 stop:436 length:414 start_codon:yes stop_codon:yes gene_type:complete